MMARQVRSDAGVVLRAANDFRAAAEPFRQKMLGLTKQDTEDESRRDQGAMIASAVNMAFAIELYLKALLIVRALQQRGHELAKLYRAIPPDLRRSIEAQYHARSASRQRGAIALYLSIFRKDVPKAAHQTGPSDPTDHTIDAVLSRSSELFTEWRYLYERGQPGSNKVDRILYEFDYLGVVADVLREHVERELQELLGGAR